MALDKIGIVVSDLPRALRFYRALGVAFAEGAEQSEHGHAELGAGFGLMVDTEQVMRSFDHEWRRAPGSPGMVLAIRCESPAAVDEMYARALEAGGRSHKEPWDAFWNQRYAQLRDPDGNGIDLYAQLGSEPSSEGGVLRPSQPRSH